MQLLLLGKLCKGSLDLPKWVTSRVDRDFRIDQRAIPKCQDKARSDREKRKRRAGGKGKGKGSKRKKGAASSSKTKSTSREASVSHFAAVAWSFLRPISAYLECSLPLLFSTIGCVCVS